MSPAKHASLFLLVVAAVPWWTAVDAAGAAPPVDLLRNGGFEDGLAAWTPDPGLRLVEQPAEAHSGAKCLHGEVTEPNRALRLRQKVAVQARNRYTFEIWARATNRTKLVLWAVMPGQGGRRSIAQWKGVPRRWRKYQIPLTVAADGVLELEIIAPSSHGAPAGEIWVDDAALHETKLPEVIDVTGGKGFNDEPAMALAGDYLFVRCGRVRVCVLSIANRWYPQLRASTIVPAADISKLLVFDDRLYVGSSDGLLVYRHCFVDNGPCGVPATYFPLITR